MRRVINRQDNALPVKITTQGKSVPCVLLGGTGTSAPQPVPRDVGIQGVTNALDAAITAKLTTKGGRVQSVGLDSTKPATARASGATVTVRIIAVTPIQADAGVRRRVVRGPVLHGLLPGMSGYSVCSTDRTVLPVQSSLHRRHVFRV
eukprot:TRINITY_DN33_c0_g1_i11.p3 TRINITY_DN33_c0_g1~~TRINITY_DN33_c0_g1_i11.p3  ORF type:complete len:148 (-),score=18.33 TRINITY_DN33_c0_g1_i11:95-538(-)